MPITEFLSDGDISQQLRVSKSCIRGQRFKRMHSLPHWLDLDPIYVGKCPRYRRTEVDAWLADLKPTGVKAPADGAQEDAA